MRRSQLYLCAMYIRAAFFSMCKAWYVRTFRGGGWGHASSCLLIARPANQNLILTVRENEFYFACSCWPMRMCDTHMHNVCVYVYRTVLKFIFMRYEQKSSMLVLYTFLQLAFTSCFVYYSSLLLRRCCRRCPLAMKSPTFPFDILRTHTHIYIRLMCIV